MAHFDLRSAAAAPRALRSLLLAAALLSAPAMLPACSAGACQYNGDCGAGQECVAHRCVSVSSPDHCPAGQAACTEDSACSSQVCMSGCCTPPCSSDSECGSGQHCTNGACVTGQPACHADSDCSAGMPVCLQSIHACVQCASTADCADPMKQCTADTHQCVYLPGNCGQASDCSDTAGTPVCDVTVHQCVQCLSNTDCTPPLICSLENNACVMPPPPHCTTDNDCDGGTATPYCDPGVGLCVQCTSTDAGQCPRPQICRADSCTAPGGCLSDNDCTSAQLPYCNISTGRCVQCVSTAACNPPQACVNYTCGMCATNVDCIGSLVGSVCDPPTGNCVQCELDSDCPKPGAMCVSNMCMGGPCSSDADCANNPNGTDYCELDAGTCVQCTVSSQCTTGLVCQNFTCGIPICMTDADCVGAGGGPHCDSTTMHCVQCTDDSQCPGGDVCDPTTHTCGLLMCTMDSDCAQDAAAQHCDPVQMICVECLQDSDCPMSQSCLEGACGTQPTCMADSDCLPSQSCVPLAANDYTVWTLRCVPNSRFGNVEGGGACGSNSDCISNNCYFFPGETSDGICLDACTTSSDCDFFNGDCPTNGVALTVPGPAGAVSVTPICWSQTCTNDYDCEYTGFEDSNRICGLMPDPTNLTGAFVESCVPAVGFVPGGNPCASDIQCMSNLCLPYTSTTPSHSGARCFGACGSDFDCSSTGTIQAKCLSSQVQNNGNTIMVHTCVVEP